MIAADRSKRMFRQQSGNVFLIILVGIAMFAALMFTFSRGVRQGTESMGGREAELAASDIVAYGQQVQRGIERMIARGISEEDISFANNIDTNYGVAACTNGNTCLVFDPAGGSVVWKAPPSNVNSGETYFYGPNRVGSTDGTTKDIGTSERDLVMLLPVNAEVCDAINAITNKHQTWVSAGNHNATIRFISSYDLAPGTVISRDNETDQPTTGCFCDGAGATCDSTDPHFFYNVLLAR